MSLSELFPCYPIGMKSPKRAKIKIASRKIYVDLPYIFWYFISDVCYKISISKSEEPHDIFKREWEAFISDEKIRNIAYFNNKLLATVSLASHSLTTKLLLKLRVRWPLFFEYLENKAQEVVSKIEVDGSNIREVYNEILDNYFVLTSIIPRLEYGRFDAFNLKNFEKLMRRLGEDKIIQQLLLNLKQPIKVLGRKAGLELWMLQLESDICGVESCLENVDIMSCYLYLRNALENLVKLVVYNSIARNFSDHKEMLLYVFFFYDKVAKERCYSIRQLGSKYVKEINEIISYLENTLDADQKVNREKIKEMMYLMMINKQLPKLGINSQTLGEFEERYGVSIRNYWSACSEILHNQSPLPFFSLLEVKSFKHFLKRYSERFISILKVISSDVGVVEELVEKKESQEVATEVTLSRQKFSKKAKEVFRQLFLQEEVELVLTSTLKSLVEDEAVKREVFFKPLTLVSLFHLFWPQAETSIISGKFNLEDMKHLITKIKPFFSRFVTEEFDTTLRILEEKLMHKIEEISPDFSKLDMEEKKVVIFYLLAAKLPQLWQKDSN